MYDEGGTHHGRKMSLIQRDLVDEALLHLADRFGICELQVCWDQVGGVCKAPLHLFGGHRPIEADAKFIWRINLGEASNLS